jgi:peptide/nickel transport system permease protein
MDALRETFGFVDAPIHEQYFTYVRNLLQGNFGTSITAFPAPVTEVIGNALVWTLRLAGTATIISFTVGTLLGVFAAWRRGKFADSFVLPVLSFIGAFPYFFVAMLLLYILAFGLKIFPLSHAYDLSIPVNWGDPAFVMSVLEHAALPVFTIVITGMSGWMLGMRNNMIGVLGEDYIVMAQAKGLSDRRVMFTYAARNAILPSVTGFAMSLGFVIGGALLTEIVFSYPGIGFWLLSAVNARDYPLMQGIFLMITLAVLLANFLADVIYVMLDPRAR